MIIKTNFRILATKPITEIVDRFDIGILSINLNSTTVKFNLKWLDGNNNCRQELTFNNLDSLETELTTHILNFANNFTIGYNYLRINFKSYLDNKLIPEFTEFVSCIPPFEEKLEKTINQLIIIRFRQSFFNYIAYLNQNINLKIEKLKRELEQNND